jgi:hypothetical protein
MTKINICGNDYTVPKPVASYLAEACDALVQERNELEMIQAGTVFEDRCDPMAVFSQKYNELMSHAYQWRILCNQIGFGWGNHYTEVIKEIIRLGPSGLTGVRADGCADTSVDAGSIAGAAAAQLGR